MTLNRPIVKICDKHFTFTTTSDVRNTCQHLFANSPISVFYHAVITENKISLVTTIPEYNQFVFANGIVPVFGSPELAHGTHYLPASKCSIERSELGKRFNIDNVIEFADDQGDKVELIGFGTTCGKPEMTNYYFDHLAQLKQFSQEFKNRACDLIVKSHQHPILISEKSANLNKLSQQFRLPNVALTAREKDMEFALSRGLGAKQITVEGVKLSLRESQCVRLLISGQTAKEVAKSLNLSSRTVEHYLANIKVKLNVHSKSKLIDKVLQNNFSEINVI